MATPPTLHCFISKVILRALNYLYFQYIHSDILTHFPLIQATSPIFHVCVVSSYSPVFVRPKEKILFLLLLSI